MFFFNFVYFQLMLLVKKISFFSFYERKNKSLV